MAVTSSSADGELLTALHHPLRRQILIVMRDADKISPRELADELEEPLSNVSYHVRVLIGCGAASLVDTEPVRGSIQHFYKFDVDEEWALTVLDASSDPTDARDGARSDDDPGGDGVDS